MNGLEQKVWYRAIKVVYIIAYVLVASITVFVLNSGGVCGGQWSQNNYIYDQCSFSTWAITLLVIVVVFEVIRWVFFYIATGKTKK